MKLIKILKNSIKLFLPSIGKNRDLLNGYKRAVKIIQKEYKELFNPLSMEFLESYLNAIKLIIELRKVLLPYFKYIESDEFYKKLTNIKLKKYSFSTDDINLKSTIKGLNKKSIGSISTIDKAYFSKLEKINECKIYYRSLINYLKLYNLINFDYTSLIEDISIDTLKDLYYLSWDLFDPDSLKSDDVYKTIAKGDEIYNYIQQFLDIFTTAITPIFLETIISLIISEYDLELEKKVITSDYPVGLIKELKGNYSIEREKFLQMQNHRQVLKRTKSLFGENQIQKINIYNLYNSNLLIEASLPSFRYIDQLNIIYSFYYYNYKTLIKPVLNDLSLNCDFYNDDIKKEYIDIFDKTTYLWESIKKFSQDIEAPTFSNITQVLKEAKKTLILPEAKPKYNKTIDKINKYAYTLIRDSVSLSVKLGVLIEEFIIDIESLSPRKIGNAFIFDKDERNIKIKEISSKYSVFNSLLRYISFNH